VGSVPHPEAPDRFEADTLSVLFDVPLAALTGKANVADIDAALAAARFAPSAANLQPWTFIRVTQSETVGLIAENSLNSLGLPMPNHRNEAIVHVGHLVLVCSNVLRAKCRFGERGLAFYAVQDIAVATHTVRLAALARGISSHWIRELDFETLNIELGLAPRFELQAVLAFGNANTKGLERPPQLDAKYFVRVEGQARAADALAARPLA